MNRAGSQITPHGGFVPMEFETESIEEELRRKTIEDNRSTMATLGISIMSFYRSAAITVSLILAQFVRADEPSIDLGSVTEKHEMIPMRDGKKLSAFLYFPSGEGPWPVLYEQRYADIRSAGSRKAFAQIASNGYVVAAQNFRGTHLSEGTWVGYRGQFRGS